jgi:transcriptional regulator with GAF, ATPase, and Fis domain
LVEGETGTGKELVADAVHTLSKRHGGRLVKVNCSALSENLLESELFGHVKGAFTGAVKDKPGRIELAEGGTLFLDEIGDISPLIQLKLLRVLQEHEYERVGDVRVRKANVRFIGATNRNLRELVAAGKFRDDIYYRICVYSIAMPALREHKVDIPLLCERFIERLNRNTGKHIRHLAPEARAHLMNYYWPGNVRQLENAIEHAFVMCFGDTITLDDLPEDIRGDYGGAVPCRVPASNLIEMGSIVRPRRCGGLTRSLLLETLVSCRWNRSAAARQLGVDRTTIWRKMKKLGVQPPDESV